MTPLITTILGGLLATYIFLKFYLHLSQNPKEPPLIETQIPFLSSLLRMIKDGHGCYINLRNQYNLPIYTLRMPFGRIYVINSTELISAAQKQWKQISFAAVAADAGTAIGMSDSSVKLMHTDLNNENSFSLSWPRYILPALTPGPDLDVLNRKAIHVLVEEMEKSATKTVRLWDWTQRIMTSATTEAVFGPQNPFRDQEVVDSWFKFESNFLIFHIFPKPHLFFKNLFEAREKVAAALIGYMKAAGYETGSGLVKRRVEHHREWNLPIEDIGRAELGNTFAVLANTTPTALWVLWHIFTDKKVLEDVRKEVLGLVREESDGMSLVDLARVKTACPILSSVFQETLRHRSLAPSVKKILEDVLLDGRYLLKKGSMLMMPAPVQHSDKEVWGDNALEFDHLRFVNSTKWNRTAFRGFGGGHVLCPGRHFASTEIMAFAAMVVLRFDFVPVAGQWGKAEWKNSPAAAQIPILDEDIEVELRVREPERTWKFVYSRSEGVEED
ncbi:cholesterol 7-alpha-monooxygenase [Podospora fimiseda]|uniref:Cholesterol 7-alpha-monooxygenase n=1 Tax=Podospora fimiseda TaxID=252190 RepID=A0AAN6YLU0_9PEZI|nr:cholesterol 7-alpha-monooxygenase [Podospora fimiseda]